MIIKARAKLNDDCKEEKSYKKLEREGYRNKNKSPENFWEKREYEI